ncbi:S41 family peptidase [Sulfurovum sp.]|uniref:S41 family peptidase n=1 Tax=Sulfurovum sp. TaxID=1969726 RepID=UPI002867B348|nr:S41 family peptidase [Sulfurovum sp.]
MTHKLLFLFILSIVLLLNSCGSGASSDDEVQVFSLDEKEFLHTLFLSEYLWFDQVEENVDYNLFMRPQEMINALRIDPPDQWSFAMTEQAYEDYSNQKTTGFGFDYINDFLIYLVRINAPAYGKLFRGDQILQINGEAVSQTLISAASQNLNVPATFTLLRDGTQIDVTVTPIEYSFNVSLGKIITQGTQKVGYLRYDSFTESSVAEFERIFTTFNDEDIDELVIDIRYNGGGSIVTASALLDNISNAYAGQRQMYLDWNENYKQNNSSYTFEDVDMQDGNELTMKRVFFLTSKSSASASEAVINALVPYFTTSNVITVGDDTHGKPVGMSGRSYGLNYYFLINFYVRNNENETTSFDGIPVTCSAEDDLTHMLGDENETMFKTALNYMATGVCL